MTPTTALASSRGGKADTRTALAGSAAAVDGGVLSDVELAAWLADRRRTQPQQVERVPFAELDGWRFEESTGDLRHASGGFFAVHGLRVRSDFGPVSVWEQPVIDQPEIGILGIAVRDFDGVTHLLMQAKSEPGNVNGMQVSPTVQATKSNYMRVHGGSAVKYLDCFRRPAPGSVVADVLQSEQGSWFLGKRNRNMIVRVGPEVEAGEDFAWLTLRQVNMLLGQDNLVNMDARTVLSCLPDWRPDVTGPTTSLHSDTEIRSWITRRRAEHEVRAVPIGLAETKDWHRDPYSVSHVSGRHFSVAAVDVVSGRREVAAWSQPLLEPHGTGIAALFVRRVDGVPHVLLRARAEAGFLSVVELGPTVQCTEENYEDLPHAARPPYLDEVRERRESAVYDVLLSEEGGRFLNAQSHYVVIEVDDNIPLVSDEFQWVSPRQVDELLRYSHHLNVQARTLIAAWRSL
ncbi:NDP-hexose 2,3-dehydratase family protein [Streptomyces hirsutus]|uniref:NDP-hexose 2,3-dehydratase family protein n=1 Tax=Streptomyces hirsutus TaxID=35620 RepID=A0ABZ1GVZ2_9ACTN|nr:NDP-hexose 2,3-dehydratase family protein [Streptomyces hirsutus]WSD10381.1 NDP-hexose 2,3-dehydratase family protein [Streptomyces hirsutus]WTD16270.1 NDP-hexose 2,3-dehydratase family protein [Streptomyces hirsutus]